LFEVLCWAQLGLHRRPIGLLNSGGYYDPLLATIQRARDEGFIYQEHHELFFTAATPEALLDLIDEYRPPSGLERWLRLDVV
jgi:predicted Rossmann-fold nucleotide-binding protein